MFTIRTHGIIDYVLGTVFLAAPYVFGFSNMYLAHDVFTVLGLAILAYSLFTDYGPSLAKAVPLGMHMSFDVAAGIFLVLAPWIYGYHGLLTPVQSAAHWVLGIGTIALVAFTGREEEPRTQILTPEGELIKMERREPKKAA